MTDFQNLNLTLQSPDLQCMVGNRYDQACVWRIFCSQMDHWIINTGILVCIIYILSGWLLWLWWNHAYVNIDWESFYMRHPALLRPSYRINALGLSISILSLGDLRLPSRKMFWDLFIRDRTAKLLLGYAVIVLYFTLA